MFKFAMMSLAAAALSGTALAVPVLKINFDVDGSQSLVTQNGTATGFGDYSYVGAFSDKFPGTTWAVGWDIASESAASAFVTNGFTITNFSSSTKRFNISLEVLDTDPGGVNWSFYGNIGGILTSDSGASSTISSYGSNPLWQGLRGGTSPGTNSELMKFFSFSSPGSTSSIIPGVVITPYPVAGPLGPSLGYQFQFDMTGKSTVAFTGIWGADSIPIPTPGSFALVGIAGIGLRKRRRSL
ncbi:MAG: hypothetical protein K8R92_06475 [Planctomycetes bacterium]|nr:hypothetical protein [Planctomycetota bacterium]